MEATSLDISHTYVTSFSFIVSIDIELLIPISVHAVEIKVHHLSTKEKNRKQKEDKSKMKRWGFKVRRIL